MGTDGSKIAQGIARRCLMVRTRAISRMITQMYDDALRPWSLKATQMNLLVAIGAMGEVAPTELGKRMALEKSTVSRTLDALKKSGWIQSEPHPTGRGQLVFLTKDGEALLAEIEPAWEDVQAKVEAKLGPASLLALDAVRSALQEP